MDTEMTENIITDMAKFYLRELFYGIPLPNIYVDEDMGFDVLGAFSLKRSDDYFVENDEFLGKYEYKAQYIALGNGFGIEFNDNESFQDPLNHPEPIIRISAKCIDNFRRLTGVLLHELLHYCLWYIGWDYRDEDMDFDRECRKMELPDNYVDNYDWCVLDRYIHSYMEYRKSHIAGNFIQ